MGAVNSAVGGCFGSDPNSVETEKKPMKNHETRHNTETDVDQPDEPILKAESSPSDKEHSREHKIFYHCHLTLEDFDLIKALGKGSFGKVYLVQKKTSKKVYALKALKKKDVMMKNLLKSTLTEKDILMDIEHPFVVQLKYSFQSTSNMYMVTDFCPGGDLSHRLKRDGAFSEEAAKFYTAEIILALEYLHEKLHIIHRDIKPENILLAEDGHVKITDFGLSKTEPQAITLCGTPGYLAPEIIYGRSYGQEVDWWSLGCLFYEMLVGTSPFGGQRTDKIIESIMRQEPKIPDHFSDPLKDLLTRFLKKNPRERLGANGGAQEVKNHPYFKGVDWESMLSKKLIPPFQVPTIEDQVNLHQQEASEISLLKKPQKQESNGVMDFPEFSFAAEDLYASIGSLESKKPAN